VSGVQSQSQSKAPASRHGPASGNPACRALAAPRHAGYFHDLALICRKTAFAPTARDAVDRGQVLKQDRFPVRAAEREPPVRVLIAGARHVLGADPRRPPRPRLTPISLAGVRAQVGVERHGELVRRWAACPRPAGPCLDKGADPVAHGSGSASARSSASGRVEQPEVEPVGHLGPRTGTPRRAGRSWVGKPSPASWRATTAGRAARRTSRASKPEPSGCPGMPRARPGPRAATARPCRGPPPTTTEPVAARGRPASVPSVPGAFVVGRTRPSVGGGAGRDPPQPGQPP